MVNNSTVPILTKRTNASRLKSLNIFLNLNFLHETQYLASFTKIFLVQIIFFLHLLDAFCRIQNETSQACFSDDLY
jgi:hypothetical protein